MREKQEGEGYFRSAKTPNKNTSIESFLATFVWWPVQIEVPTGIPYAI